MNVKYPIPHDDWLKKLRERFPAHQFSFITDESRDIPTICLSVDGHTIRANWTHEVAEHLKKFHGLNIAEEMFGVLNEETEKYLREARVD